MFTKEKKVFNVVEVPANTKLPELTSEIRESLRILHQLPAFNYLMQRTRLQRSAVHKALEEGIDKSEAQLRFLQGVAFGLNYMEADLSGLTRVSQPTRVATSDEASEFARIKQAIELVQ